MSKFEIDTGLSLDTSVETSTPNVLKLLKKTKEHPKGRIEIGDDGKIVNPKHNVSYVNEIPITVTSDDGRKHKIGVKPIEVNGGHVKAYHPVTGRQEDTPWRMSLGGPYRYHQLVLKLAEVKRKNPTSKDQVVPELEEEEFNEYVMYVEYLKDTKTKHKLTKFYDKTKSDNVKFYEWVGEKGVALDDEGVVVYGTKKDTKKDKAKKDSS